MKTALFTLISYLSGSIMFSYIFVKLITKKDIRKCGSGNPGAANAFRVGGAIVGVLSLIFDFLKGAVPVAIAKYACDFSGFEMLFISFAPILGHGFPFMLKFEGGKVIATSYGVWMVLTLWKVPVIWGLITVFWLVILKKDHLSVVVAMFFLIFYFMFIEKDLHMTALAFLNQLVLVWRGRSEIFIKGRF